ncbi:MAG: hypothetical protein Q4C67_09165, partial [Deinococcus sp.]|nr:hypothetical protein [Deinococcus sp.]
WLADGARNAGPTDEAEALFFSRWQDDLCHRESGALQRLAELLDPELAEQLRSEEQEIPAEPADA